MHHELHDPTPCRSCGRAEVWRPIDVANFWKVTPRTIRTWVENGRHPAPLRDPGGRPFWPAETVIEFERTRAADQPQSSVGDVLSDVHLAAALRRSTHRQVA